MSRKVSASSTITVGLYFSIIRNSTEAEMLTACIARGVSAETTESAVVLPHRFSGLTMHRTGEISKLSCAHPAVGSVLAISGLYDLEPISLCGWSDPLQLTGAEIDRFSPQRQFGPGAPMLVAVGAEERPELLRQSRDYAAACRQAGEPAELLLVAGRNHFDVLDDLADPQGAQLTALAALGA